MAATLPTVVGLQQLDQGQDVALIDDEAAGHEHLARPQRRVGQDAALGGLVGEADGDGSERAGAVTEPRLSAVGVDHGQRALPDRAAKEMIDQRHGQRR